MCDSSSKQAKMNLLLNRKRKIDAGVEPEIQQPSSSQEMGEDVEFVESVDKKSEEERRKAAEVIVKEARRAKERAELVGPQGWLRPKSLNTNKQFLHRTLAATLAERRPKHSKRVVYRSPERDSRKSETSRSRRS
ncbi:unnamed protein product [Cylicocyclus nassatus]|uniref:Uncharacterized protein n=1 Tax=Cylicocyclus nassatus TaxID=53992 RepID=A0AA36H3L6_CYLNA|nr:unnamed protein product [Cylicocyclus nassatus]